MRIKRVVYACKTDWEHEIGEAADLEGSMPLYSSIKELKAKRTCWDECGIVELNLIFSRVVEEGVYGEGFQQVWK